MALVHSDRIARNLTIRKFNTLLRLENETIRPDIPLLLGLTIQNPQTPPPLPTSPFPSQFYGNTLYRSSLNETRNENRWMKKVISSTKAYFRLISQKCLF